MDLLNLLQELGLAPRRIGGEYHSACPDPCCGGTDRFIIWPETDHYWCRQCKKSGDAIQFCRDFLGLSFQEARAKTGGVGNRTFPQRHGSVSVLPSGSWKEKAQEFVSSSHERLLINSKAMEIVRERGLTIERIKQYRLGWNPTPTFPSREEWGLEKKIQDGKKKKLFLPAGIVIPSYRDGELHKIKIRHNDWMPNSSFSKYLIISGSGDCATIFGDPNKRITVLVEAEFDAMLIAQEAGALCSSLALGGAQKRPDPSTHQWLQDRDLIIFSLDFDAAGKREYDWWQDNYPNLEPWPAPKEKSPGDYFKIGGNIRDWIVEGVHNLLPVDGSI